MTPAAPTPATARAVISSPGSCEAAASSIAAPKTTVPPASMSLRPKRSPALPNGSSSPAKVSVYASTIHCSWVSVAPVARARLDKATFSPETAEMTIISARQETTSTTWRRAAGSGVPGAGRAARSGHVGDFMR